jgi:hypothetical protein
LINKIDSKGEYIKNALKMFETLKALPRNSDMMIIGLVSIIESLITHNPKIKDLSDSLTHQISTKLPLLFKRSNYKLDHAQYFGNEKIEKILTGIYQYRSYIVHGGKTDFRSNTFRILRNRETVLKYLTEIVKLLLIFALNEPEFITDLKKC